MAKDMDSPDKNRNVEFRDGRPVATKDEDDEGDEDDEQNSED